MSILLEKSEQNHKAFILLKEYGYLTPCVHCGYYSCFQKVTYILEEYFPEQNEAINVARQNRSKGNLHKERIEEFVRQFRKLASPQKAKQLRDHLLNLKAYRIEADYQKEEITETKIEVVTGKVEEFRYLLRTYLKI